MHVQTKIFIPGFTQALESPEMEEKEGGEENNARLRIIEELYKAISEKWLDGSQ